MSPFETAGAIVLPNGNEAPKPHGTSPEELRLAKWLEKRRIARTARQIETADAEIVNCRREITAAALNAEKGQREAAERERKRKSDAERKAEEATNRAEQDRQRKADATAQRERERQERRAEKEAEAERKRAERKAKREAERAEEKAKRAAEETAKADGKRIERTAAMAGTVFERLDLDRFDNVIPSDANLCMILKHDSKLAEIVSFDAFGGTVYMARAFPTYDDAGKEAAGPYPRAFDLEDDAGRLLTYVQHRYKAAFRKSQVQDAIVLEAKDRRFHPVLKWLSELPKWDKTPRLDKWLHHTLGCLDDPYTRAVSSKILIAAVRRVRRPGCKFDFVPVLEGAQGIGKSSTLAMLFGKDWFTDDLASMDGKDGAISLAGKWCVELAEIAHLAKSTSETVKAFITRSVDHYRPPYGRHAIDVPRQGVMLGTTNANSYLTDPTGNRRYWPVQCERHADFAWLKANRLQLWAEATEREGKGEKLWLDDGEVAKQAAMEQEARLETDAWDELIDLYLTTTHKHLTVTIARILEDAGLDIPIERRDRKAQLRVGAILRKLRWTHHTARDDNNVPYGCWRRPTKA